MNYRSIDDLNRLIASACHRVPHNVDLIVGVPRSGMLAANLLALHLNLPVTDIDGLLGNRSLKWGMHRSPKNSSITSVNACRKILVIDDSILSGRHMTHVRKQIEDAGMIEKTLLAAVYCTKEKAAEIDLAFEVCPIPRVFEWNLMHSNLLENCCVDIDGVLCVDPTPTQNDDGEKYSRFIAEAQVYMRPTRPIGILVTSRLEKYRTLTEQWLAEHDIQFGKLIMMDYATMEQRQAAAKYAEFKADAYKTTDTHLFIESSWALADKIAGLAGKPVLAVDIQKMFDPFGLPYVHEQGKQLVKNSTDFSRRAFRKLGRIASRIHNQFHRR